MKRFDFDRLGTKEEVEKMTFLECLLLMRVQVEQYLQRTPDKLKEEHEAQKIMDRIRNET